MSTVSQGPGWWLASDGKWYPPHLHPSVGPPPPPPPSAVFGGAQAPGFAPPVAPPPGAWGQSGQGAYATPPAWANYSDGVVDPVLGLRLAPWWKRLVAIIIDNIIIGIAGFIVFLVLGIALNASSVSNSNSSSSPASGGAVLAAVLIVGFIVSIPVGLYFAIMNGSRRGQTVGKMALSIAVRDSRTGAPIGFWRGLGRFYITGVFSLLLYVPYLIDSLAPLWDKRRQSWHDKVARSVVVDLNP